MSRTAVLCSLLCCALWAAAVPAAAAGGEPSATPSIEARSRALERASAATVGVQALAVDGARSAATLGRTRQGSGVVIDRQGLVLTIGYLILEVDQVLIVPDDARRVPARVVAYDLATGFGLLRALVPLGLEPVPLGQSQSLTRDENLMVASGGEDGALSMARMVSRRGFSGYWEYHIDDALFTAPPRPDHSGAGLFNERGELVGIGSLIVADAAGGGSRSPGNMFVPVDLLRPILTELIANGRSRQSERAWVGINCVDVDGRIRIVRVNEDSPADVAGFQVGDQITGIDGKTVTGLEQLWKTLWAGSGSERAVRIDIERGGEKRSLTVHSVDRAKTLRRAEGV
jgi:serine protease Do